MSRDATMDHYSPQREGKKVEKYQCDTNLLMTRVFNFPRVVINHQIHSSSLQSSQNVFACSPFGKFQR